MDAATFSIFSLSEGDLRCDLGEDALPARVPTFIVQLKRLVTCLKGVNSATTTCKATSLNVIYIAPIGIVIFWESHFLRSLHWSLKQNLGGRFGKVEKRKWTPSNTAKLHGVSASILIHYRFALAPSPRCPSQSSPECAITSAIGSRHNNDGRQ